MRKVIMCLILLFPFCIKAYECSDEDRERLQKLANNVSMILEENSDHVFSVTFTGVSKEIRIYNAMNLSYYRNLSNNEIGETTINNLVQNMTYRFEIYSSMNTCIMDKFRVITINVPRINPYYQDDICSEIKEYSLCQKFTPVNLSYDEFVKKINKYKEMNKQREVIKVDNVSEDSYFIFLKFYNKYYWPMFIFVICIFVLLVILWKKESKKNRL